MKGLKATQWMFKYLKDRSFPMAEVAVGGQCCYEDGPSALLTINTPEVQIEIQLSEVECRLIAHKLLTVGVKSATYDTCKL